ncbi:unnamed protein product [Amoebophrya sp. A120]|nr:unnamed protein product [Amoebophrya sp. A120]|eukprot:GSA120T00022426001.1
MFRRCLLLLLIASLREERLHAAEGSSFLNTTPRPASSTATSSQNAYNAGPASEYNPAQYTLRRQARINEDFSTAVLEDYNADSRSAELVRAISALSEDDDYTDDHEKEVHKRVQQSEFELAKKRLRDTLLLLDRTRRHKDTLGKKISEEHQDAGVFHHRGRTPISRDPFPPRTDAVDNFALCQRKNNLVSANGNRLTAPYFRPTRRPLSGRAGGSVGINKKPLSHNAAREEHEDHDRPRAAFFPCSPPCCNGGNRLPASPRARRSESARDEEIDEPRLSEQVEFSPAAKVVVKCAPPPPDLRSCMKGARREAAIRSAAVAVDDTEMEQSRSDCSVPAVAVATADLDENKHVHFATPLASVLVFDKNAIDREWRRKERDERVKIVVGGLQRFLKGAPPGAGRGGVSGLAGRGGSGTASTGGEVEAAAADEGTSTTSSVVEVNHDPASLTTPIDEIVAEYKHHMGIAEDEVRLEDVEIQAAAASSPFHQDPRVAKNSTTRATTTGDDTSKTSEDLQDHDQQSKVIRQVSKHLARRPSLEEPGAGSSSSSNRQNQKKNYRMEHSSHLPEPSFRHLNLFRVGHILSDRSSRSPEAVDYSTAGFTPAALASSSTAEVVFPRISSTNTPPSSPLHTEIADGEAQHWEEEEDDGPQSDAPALGERDTHGGGTGDFSAQETSPTSSCNSVTTEGLASPVPGVTGRTLRKGSRFRPHENGKDCQQLRSTGLDQDRGEFLSATKQHDRIPIGVAGGVFKQQQGNNVEDESQDSRVRGLSSLSTLSAVSSAATNASAV